MEHRGVMSGNFEEVLENREMIEDRIFRIKLKMVDFSVKSWDNL
jgi:hypothetical protein